MRRYVSCLLLLTLMALWGCRAKFEPPQKTQINQTNQSTGSPGATPPASEPDTNCRRSKREIQAGDVIADLQSLNYRGYIAEKLYKKVRLDVPPEYAPPPKPVRVSYAAIKRRGRIIAKFDTDIYFPLGNTTDFGLFPLLNDGSQQLIISQDISRTGVQWVVDLSKGFKVIFDGQKFDVGRESYDMTMSDLDGDGIYEITVPIADFYGFQHWRLSTMETPLPGIVFKYDPAQRQYLPANPLFKACLLKHIEEAEKNVRSINEQTSLGSLMSVVLDYIFVGEEQHGWIIFEKTCRLPDKAKIKADMQGVLNRHPVYRYIYKNRGNR